jgi:hypothetical protein
VRYSGMREPSPLAGGGIERVLVVVIMMATLGRGAGRAIGPEVESAGWPGHATG